MKPSSKAYTMGKLSHHERKLLQTSARTQTMSQERRAFAARPESQKVWIKTDRSRSNAAPGGTVLRTCLSVSPRWQVGDGTGEACVHRISVDQDWSFHSHSCTSIGVHLDSRSRWRPKRR